MSLLPPVKESHHDKLSPYSPNFPFLFLKLNIRVCCECQTPYLAVLCHFVTNLGFGTQKPHSKSIQNHPFASLNNLVCQVVCIQTMNHIGKISCNCLRGKRKEKKIPNKLVVDISLDLNKTLFVVFLFFCTFSFVLLLSLMAICVALPLLT